MDEDDLDGGEPGLHGVGEWTGHGKAVNPGCPTSGEQVNGWGTGHVDGRRLKVRDQVAVISFAPRRD